MSDSKTSKSDFDYFVKAAKSWIRRFGLTDYTVDFERRDTTADQEPLCSARAAVIYDLGGRTATIILNANYGEGAPTKQSLSADALHEVLHLLLAELSMQAKSRFSISEEWLSAAEHGVIARLQNFIEGKR